ncbi:MAG: nucleotide exchange factor GrpE [Betaproteobacteria bacterium]|nr:nucleotide exchange factor GrpE [Betaproteobacteria bacterium]
MSDQELPITPLDPAQSGNGQNAAEPTQEEAPSQDSMPSLQELLRKAELSAQEHHDAWLRAKAEADNVRKRAQVDVANAHKYAIETFAAELLPVKDGLEATLRAENASFEALKSGVELTLKQLAAVFEKVNIREVNPEGEKFDPHRHQAISMLPSEKEPNTVINVLQKGYLLHDRVVRPALVTVAKARDA